ncbi:endonuclease/exonuclease/phosphatase family protein [Microbacterium sp. NPDC090003]|uniref:endonuclease/exonuclease/phosphatase family protein n=1 Tax=Microbacterium sp. NPDC090003 TaxID=3364203 RepID=UPI003801BAA9
MTGSATLIGPVAPPEVHVMTLNARRAMEGPLIARADRWSTREPAVHALLASERPTLLGLQEALPRVMPPIRRALGDGYRSLGRGRGRGGTGEGTPVLYDGTRLQLVDGGQRALSDRPDLPGSLGWGNVIPRIAVWAEFVDRSTGARLLVVNTHLDPFSRRSRQRSSEAIAAFIGERGVAAIVMGDLNADVRSTSVRALVAGDRLTDAWAAADAHLTPEWGTYTHYRRPRVRTRRIDAIAVTPDVRVRATGANARTFAGAHPSDHLAVQAVIRVDGAARRNARRWTP